MAASLINLMCIETRTQWASRMYLMQMASRSIRTFKIQLVHNLLVSGMWYGYGWNESTETLYGLFGETNCDGIAL